MSELNEIAKKASEVLHLPLNGGLSADNLIRIYYFLSVLSGGDEVIMRHWLNTHNSHLGFNPAAKLCDENSVQKIINYLESFIDR